jgi:Uma2 family endonuclease
MTTSLRMTSADLASLPDEDGKRYEIIDGELYVSKQPHLYHQETCGAVEATLRSWSKQTGLGNAYGAPGIIFADDDDVAPDVIWISKERLAVALWPDGKLHAAPELVVEVLSPGSANQLRDRELKLELYSRRCVHEYWIADWRLRQIVVYRRQEAQLKLVGTLCESDTLASPLLPGFSCGVNDLFAEIPRLDTPDKE